MEEKTAEELYRGNEGWQEFPKTYKWKKALAFAKEKYEGRTNFEQIKGIMNILINEERETDDIILTIAALCTVLENTNCTKEELEQEFGKITARGVDLLTRKEGQSLEDYSKQVFTNEDYLIIREIKLADILHNLRTVRLTNNPEEISRKTQETETYILPYEKYAPRNLMNKIKEEIATLKSTPRSKTAISRDEDDEYSL